VTVKDVAGNVFAQSAITYDEGGQYAQLNDYPSVTNWSDLRQQFAATRHHKSLVKF